MDRQAEVQQRLQRFVANLGEDLGEPALGALLVIQWPSEVVTGVTMASLPKAQTFGIINGMSRVLATCLDRLRAQINQTRSD
jgi:hypothetical protein